MQNVRESLERLVLILHSSFRILHFEVGVAGNAPTLGTHLVRLSFIKRTMLFTSHPRLESGQGNAPCDHCFADSSVLLLGRRT